MEDVLPGFLSLAASDTALAAFAQGRHMTSHYVLEQAGLEFYMRFVDGVVEARLGAPEPPAEVRLWTTAATLDGMFTGRINAMRAFMTVKLRFDGEGNVAMALQQIQSDLRRLYKEATSRHQSAEAKSRQV
jgi:putative sterol carrier protein